MTFVVRKGSKSRQHWGLLSGKAQFPEKNDNNNNKKTNKHDTGSGAPLLSKFGDLSIREILVVTLAYVRPSVQTLGGRGGISRQPDKGGGGGGECLLFLEGNRAVLLGNRRFSWREIT